jgi:hypothetical protein
MLEAHVPMLKNSTYVVVSEEARYRAGYQIRYQHRLPRRWHH